MGLKADVNFTETVKDLSEILTHIDQLVLKIEPRRNNSQFSARDFILNLFN